MKIITNQSLKNYNTFGINAKAKYFADVSSLDELQNLLSNNEIPSDKNFILGGGSNVLFVNDFDGLVIKNSIPGINIMSEDETNVIIEAGAGVVWDELVQFCVDKNYGGIE
ncbi:MAG: FAD-binding protein, partial [Ignavibacterium sp.]